MILRPYQHEARYWVNRQLNNSRNPLLVMPTGTGKTKTAIQIIIDRILLKQKVIVVVPQIEIFDQWIGECSQAEVIKKYIEGFKKNDLNYGYINDEGVQGRNKHVYICMAQSLDNILIALPEKFVKAIQIIITDETHHSSATTWINIYNHFEHAQRLGLTATPYRMDNKPLSEYYDCMFEAITMSEAIAKGYLCKPIIIIPDEYKNNVPDIGVDIDRNEQRKLIKDRKIIGDMVRAYKEVFDGLPVIVPCSNHKHAEFVTELYINAGWQVDHIHSKMSKSERNAILQRLRKNETNILITVGVGVEGMDIPGLYGIIWLRFTESLTIYMQFNGRSMRPAKGKEFFIMIDPVGNSVIHGRPDIDRKWSLTTDYIPGQDVSDAPTSQICAVCGVVNSIENNKCWICGYDFKTGLDKDGKEVDKKKRKLPKMIDGQLVYLDGKYNKDGEENEQRRQGNDNLHGNSNNNSDNNDNNSQDTILTKLQKVEILHKDLTGLKMKNKFKEGLKWL